MRSSPAPSSCFLVFLGLALCACMILSGFQEPASGLSPTRTKLGNEIFVESLPQELRGKRLGLVINQTALLPDGTPLYSALNSHGGNVSAIFSPEHGFTGQVRGGEKVTDSRLADMRVFSLYGKTRKPTREQIGHIDAFVYDIQDVGTRFYTYITTLKYVLEAASGTGIPVYVLDRPNPAGGKLVEGPLLREEHTSFIGALPIPIRYGLTCGELAAMMKGEGWVPSDVDLHIILMQGWRRDFVWKDTGLPWIPTSPNIPQPETAIAYPGTGLLGGIILNQGLGTAEPFLRFGAPWFDPLEVSARLPAQALLGIRLDALTYTPRPIAGKSLDPPYKDRICRGMRIHLTDPGRFRSVHFTLELIRTLKTLYPDKIYQGSSSLTLMFGTDALARYLKGELSYPDLLAGIHADEEAFLSQRRPYLLY
jgi:uncharacterized protein YbbC (DUF1343 family)